MRPGAIFGGSRKAGDYARCFGNNYHDLFPERVAKIVGNTDRSKITRDVYANGSYVKDFECRLALLTGHEAALHFPTGAMAQQVACRIWSETRGINRIAFHPTCQLRLNEEHAYSVLHNLEAVTYGAFHTVPSAPDVEELYEVAVTIFEVPLRQIGGRLIPFDELERMTSLLRSRQVKLHLDGARIFEAAAAYGVSVSKITSLFDSCYVSLYKGVGLPAGAILTGSNDFIETAKCWRKRMGGVLFDTTPLLFGCNELLDHCLAQAPKWHEQASEFASLINASRHMKTLPDPIQTNIVHVAFDAGAEAVMRARDQIADEFGIWTFGVFIPIENGSSCFSEVEVRDAMGEVSPAEVLSIVKRFDELLESMRN